MSCRLIYTRLITSVHNSTTCLRSSVCVLFSIGCARRGNAEDRFHFTFWFFSSFYLHHTVSFPHTSRRAVLVFTYVQPDKIAPPKPTRWDGFLVFRYLLYFIFTFYSLRAPADETLYETIRDSGTRCHGNYGLKQEDTMFLGELEL